jgi:hypothetical protein
MTSVQIWLAVIWALGNIFVTMIFVWRGSITYRVLGQAKLASDPMRFWFYVAIYWALAVVGGLFLVFVYGPRIKL